jgi:hypothetical protein
LCDEARDDVGAAARRDWHDEADRFCGIGLRASERSYHCGAGNKTTRQRRVQVLEYHSKLTHGRQTRPAAAKNKFKPHLPGGV